MSCNEFLYLSSGDRFTSLGYILIINKVAIITMRC